MTPTLTQADPDAERPTSPVAAVLAVSVHAAQISQVCPGDHAHAA